MQPPYKTPINTWYTRAIFWETAMMHAEEDRPIQPVFTLKHDKPGLINGRKAFVELGDPTGYKWAMKYLGDWDHWLTLLKCSWFQKHLAEWRGELDAKLASEAVDRIREIAADETDKSSLTAAKWLASKPWNDKTSNRGRPSAAELKGELKQAAAALTAEDEDAQRIGLRIVK